METKTLRRALVHAGDAIVLPLTDAQLDHLGLPPGTPILIARQGLHARTPQKPAKRSPRASTTQRAAPRQPAPGTSVKRQDPASASMEGGPLPPFSMQDADGNSVTDESLKGTPYVLYFYPKDDTPGCTKEACGIRDAWADFGKAGLAVYGVSKDDAASHAKFQQKYELPFPLLTADEPTLEALGVWKEKNMYGRKYMGIARETYLVSADGNVLKHYEKVKPAEHAKQLLADFQAAS